MYGKIDRCVCFNVSFSEIMKYASENRTSIDEAKYKLQCCTRCKLCTPYIEKMKQTGIVEFKLGDKR